ncbi:MAG: hypothetical protein HUJ27_16320 [Rhodobacteraceae bacterium]|nr:hypothetical protein [Paracoccaceae bacterium]
MAWFDRLGTRMAGLLSLALLPLGVLAVVQTHRLGSEAEEQFQAALTADLTQTVSASAARLSHAWGVADALAADPKVLLSPGDCERRLSGVVSGQPSLAALSVVTESGQVICRSGSSVSGAVVEVSLAEGPAVLRVMLAEEVLLPVRQFTTGDARPYDVLVLKPDSGTGSALSEEQAEKLPVRWEDLAAVRLSASFVARGRDGERRVYAMAPAPDGEGLVLAFWQPSRLSSSALLQSLPALFYPLAMWLVTISVAFIVVHRLVLRHIRSVLIRMRAFSRNRRIVDDPYFDRLPAELRELSETFSAMTETLLRDEADLQNAVHEKTVLLREVHHRVKNNLQLIASIMNMQMRKCSEPETRLVLRRLQDRVIGLATVHRSLYEAASLSQVREDQLLKQVVTQLLATSGEAARQIELNQTYDEVTLQPEQAMPLALAATEAVTNALKYIGRPGPDQSARLGVHLRQAEGQITLEVSNSLGVPIMSLPSGTSDGLGSDLINAFAVQLDGRTEREMSEEDYVLRVIFPLSGQASAEDAA